MELSEKRQAGADLSAAKLKEAVRIFEEWEISVDYNSGSAALSPDIERLIKRLYSDAFSRSYPKRASAKSI